MKQPAGEMREFSVRFLAGATAVLVVGLALSLAATWKLWRYLEFRQQRLAAQRYPLMAEAAPKEPPPPKLQARPIEDLHRLREREDAELHSYAWVDRSKGLVRIPIDRAMRLVVERRYGGAGEGTGP